MLPAAVIVSNYVNKEFKNVASDPALATIDKINLLIETYEYLKDIKLSQKEKTEIRLAVLLQLAEE